MAERIFVEPALGAIVPNPEAGMAPIIPEGQYVMANSYFRRRIAERGLRLISEAELARRAAAKAAALAPPEPGAEPEQPGANAAAEERPRRRGFRGSEET